MEKLNGRSMVKGRARAKALVTRMPVNFTAAFTKPVNMIPNKRGEIQDRHHDLFKKNVANRVLVFPACIGSTFTGMVLMQLMVEGRGPAAMIVQNADSLLVSGAVLAETWFKKGVPVIEYAGADLFDKIKTNNTVEVDGDTGEIRITGG